MENPTGEKVVMVNQIPYVDIATMLPDIRETESDRQKAMDIVSVFSSDDQARYLITKEKEEKIKQRENYKMLSIQSLQLLMQPKEKLLGSIIQNQK